MAFTHLLIPSPLEGEVRVGGSAADCVMSPLRHGPFTRNRAARAQIAPHADGCRRRAKPASLRHAREGSCKRSAGGRSPPPCVTHEKAAANAAPATVVAPAQKT